MAAESAHVSADRAAVLSTDGTAAQSAVVCAFTAAALSTVVESIGESAAAY